MSFAGDVHSPQLLRGFQKNVCPNRQMFPFVLAWTFFSTFGILISVPLAVQAGSGIAGSAVVFVTVTFHPHRQ